MKHIFKGVFITAGIVILGVSQSHAREESFADTTDMVSIQEARWELGIHFGVAILLDKPTVTLLANNAAFLISDPADPGENEFGEFGFPEPDYSAQTVLQGPLDSAPSYLVGMRFYYHAIPWVSVGFEGSYDIEHTVNIDLANAGPFSPPLYITRVKMSGFQVAPSVRLGDWMGWVRPYVMLGAGPYIRGYTITAELNDPDDALHPPVDAGGRQDTYLSTLYGAGIDLRVGHVGSVGACLQYQTVYADPDQVRVIIPTMYFAAHF